MGWIPLILVTALVVIGALANGLDGGAGAAVVVVVAGAILLAGVYGLTRFVVWAANR